MAEPNHIVVLCGASNLQIAFPVYLRAILARLEPPIEIYAAMGFGRSFGKWAGIGRGLLAWPGITQSSLRSRIQNCKTGPETKVHAFITDIGNDIMYAVDPPQLRRWVESMLTVFDGMNANIAATSLPMDRLQEVPAWKYAVISRLYRCKLERQQALDRAAEFQKQQEDWGRAGRFKLLPTRKEWYGFDHIHIRLWRRKLAVQCWLDEWLGPVQYEVPRLNLPDRKLIFLPAEQRNVWGKERRTEQVGVELADGVRLELY